MCILGAGLAARLVVVWLFRGVPLTIVDEQHYATLASNLLDGLGFGWGPDEATSIRPPLFPAFVALLWRLVGHESLTAIRLANAALGVLAGWLTWRVGRRLYSARAGLMAAAVVTFYPTLLFSTGLLLTEPLFLVFLLFSLAGLIRVVEKPSATGALLTGVALGAAALTRSIMWPFVGVLAAGSLLGLVRGPLRLRAAVAVAFVAGYAVVVGPWAVRNTRLQGTLTVVDTMGGMNLMMGNYAHTPEHRMWDAVSLTGDLSWSASRPGMQPDGRPWTEGAKEKWAQKQALAYMAAHPGQTVRRSALKLADLWGLEREFIAGVQRGAYGMPGSLALILTALANVVYAGVAVLFVSGVWLAPPDEWRAHAWLVGLVLFVCAVHAIVFGHSRYHLPLVPIMAWYAAAAIDRRVWRASWRSPRAAGALITIGLLVVVWLREVLVRDADQLRSLLGLAGAP